MLALCSLNTSATFAAESKEINLTELVSKACGYSVESNPFWEVISKFAGSGAGIANTVLNPFNNKNEDCITEKVNDENSIVTKAGAWHDRFVVVFFIIVGAIVLPFTLLKIARDHAKGDHAIKGYNWSFFTQRIVYLTFAIGMKGVFKMMCSAMIIGIVLSTVLMIVVTPTFTKTTKIDAGVMYKRATQQISKISPTIIAQMIQVHLRDLEVNTSTYASYAMVFDKGVYKERPSTVVKGKTIDGFPDCLAKPTEEPYFLGDVFVSPPLEKTTKCIQEMGVVNVASGRAAYAGDDKSIQNALIAADISARSIAADIKAVACTSFLNRNNNRETQKDELLIYKQCVDLNAAGIVKKQEGVIQLYDSSLSEKDIQSKYKDAVNQFNSALSGYVNGLQEEIKNEVEEEEQEMDMITLAVSMLQKNNISNLDVTAHVRKELEKITVSDSQEAQITPGIASMMGMISSSDSYAANKREQAIDFDRYFENVIRTQIQENDGLVRYSGLFLNLLSVNYFENTGMTFKDCFAISVSCVPPVMNQAAAQYQNAVSVLDELTIAYVSIKTVSAYYQMYAVSNGSIGNIAKATSQASKARNAERIASTIKFFIWFFLGCCVIQALILIVSLIGSLQAWIYNAPISYIRYLRQTAEQMKPTSHEVQRFDVLKTILVKTAWLALSPVLSVIFFFMSAAMFCLILTVSNSMILWMVGDLKGVGIEQVMQIITYVGFGVIVNCSILVFIVLGFNKMFRIIEKWFDVGHSQNGSMEAISVLNKVESQAKSKVGSKVSLS